MAKKAIWDVVASGVAAAAVVTAAAFTVPAAAEIGGRAVTAGQAVTVGQAAQIAAVQAAAPKGTAAQCARLKKHDERRKDVIARLQGNADLRGSIAWLTAQAAAATKSGDTMRAKLDTDKAALRTQAVKPLQTVESDLAAVIKAKCS